MSIVANIGTWVESNRVQNFILGVIVVNAVTLGLETSPAAMAAAGDLLHVLDKIALTIFVAEIVAKLAHQRARFFRSGWNVFDFIIVSIALVPASGPFAVLRALRILRAFRLLSVVPSMRRVVGALLTAIPGMLSVIALISLIFYVAAVVTTNFFAASHPDWFGSIGASLYTLFQIMTLESWSMGIVRPVMEVHPWAWAFFVPFIMITSFAVINLFIGIIVDSMQTQHEQEEDVIRQGDTGLHDDIRALHAEVRELKAMLNDRG